MPTYGLGRIHKPDPRDWSVTPLLQLAGASTRTARAWWSNGGWNDQGNTPTCVGASLWHWVVDGPVTHGQTERVPSPKQIYDRAQELDEIPGKGDGTTVRGGAKALTQYGFVDSYWWGSTLGQLTQMVLTGGPVVVGTNWYDDMFTSEPPGYRCRIGGKVAGGHAYVVDGVNLGRATFRLKNSWGRDWGWMGFGIISFDDMARLLEEDGEAMLAVEHRVGKNPAAPS